MVNRTTPKAIAVREVNAITKRAQAEADSNAFLLCTKCVKVKGTFGGEEVLILIDGRSNFSYVCSEVAHHAQVQWYTDAGHEEFTLSNGTLETAEVHHVEGLVVFQGYSYSVHLNVVDALVYDCECGDSNRFCII